MTQKVTNTLQMSKIKTTMAIEFSKKKYPPRRNSATHPCFKTVLWQAFHFICQFVVSTKNRHKIPWIVNRPKYFIRITARVLDRHSYPNNQAWIILNVFTIWSDKQIFLFHWHKKSYWKTYYLCYLWLYLHFLTFDCKKSFECKRLSLFTCT